MHALFGSRPLGRLSAFQVVVSNRVVDQMQFGCYLFIEHLFIYAKEEIAYVLGHNAI